MKKINTYKKEVITHKRKETERLNKKIEHLLKLREEKEEDKLENCPEIIEEYTNATIFNEKEFDRLVEEEVEIKVVGNVPITEEEKAVLKLNPKFAILERLKSETMEIETEMGLAKYRYNIVKEDEIMDEVMEEEDEDSAPKKWRRLNKEEEDLMEQIELIEAESRKIFDCKSSTLDYSKKRATDLKENSEVNLPHPTDPSTESSIHKE